MRRSRGRFFRLVLVVEQQNKEDKDQVDLPILRTKVKGDFLLGSKDSYLSVLEDPDILSLYLPC